MSRGVDVNGCVGCGGVGVDALRPTPGFACAVVVSDSDDSLDTMIFPRKME